MGVKQQRFCSISCSAKLRTIANSRRYLRKWTESDLVQAYERVVAGTTIKQIAVEANVNETSIGRLLKRRFNYQPTPFRRPTLSIPEQATVRAYIAGLVDGEGSVIFLNKHWCAKVGMTDEPVIRWLASFGGLFSAEKRLPPRKQAFYWSVHRRHDLIHLLTALLPYLRVKHDLAQRVLHEIALNVRNQ